MKQHRRAPLLFVLLTAIALACCTGQLPSLQAGDPIRLWSEETPPWTAPQEPEGFRSNPAGRGVAGKPVKRLTNVSHPELHLFPAPNAETTIIICPGGGYSILAWDLEGTEVAAWLQSNGISCAVLKYRVPSRNEPKRWLPPVQDIQRSIALIRSGSIAELPAKNVGILGFSAGGNACAHAATAGERHYTQIDEKDNQSVRPDFAILAYPAYLLASDAKKKKGDKANTDVIVEKPDLQLAETIKVGKDSPPMFFAHAFDDRISCLGSIAMFSELKRYNIPSAIHIFSQGGHGFGRRPVGMQHDSWLTQCRSWMVDNGWASATK